MNAELISLAERQHGVVTRQQIIGLGLSVRSIETLRTRGDLAVTVHGVYRVGGSPKSWEQRVMAAWLHCTGPIHLAVVAFRTAAAIHQFSGFARSGTPTLVTYRGGSHRSEVARVITCKDLRPQDITPTNPSGLLVTSKVRTVFDLALTTRSTAQLDRLLDRCLIDRHATIPELWDLLLRVQARGKTGVVALRAALTRRSDAYVPLKSELEHLAVEALARFGVPDPVRQHPLPGAPFGRVDLAFPAARLIVELDGSQHRTASARRADYERDASAAREGWIVLRFDWYQVKYSPAWFAGAVDDVRRSRELLFASAA